MSTKSQTVLDSLLEQQAVPCRLQQVTIAPEDLVHIVGSQEPVRDQPDDRAMTLLLAGWLKIEYVDITLSHDERANVVTNLQKAARAWLKQTPADATPADREQARWIVEKTRSHESKQQISQRIWLAAALYGLGLRGLRFDAEGQIHWEGGVAGRIGISPDALLDLAWQQQDHQTFSASFRQLDGTIARGKGRQRWHIYRLTIDPAAAPMYQQYNTQVRRRVALIVASQTYATQPQLPRDFYGGDAFQQACIDAQDQQYDHILVLSPKHGILSLDDTVPTEITWDEMLEHRIWMWQTLAMQRLGRYLYEGPRPEQVKADWINWWAWLNPYSRYEFTVFGNCFAVNLLLDYLQQNSERQPERWPYMVLADRRPGYDAGDFGRAFNLDEGPRDEDDKDIDRQPLEIDVEQLMDLANELAGIVNVFVPPTGETWEVAPDEALLPLRLLTQSNMDIEDMLDLLTDIMLLLEQALPISLIINANMVVSVMIQITHSLVHDEREPIYEMLGVFAEPVLHQYVEKALQETRQEDLLCACLTLAEQMQVLALAIPPHINDQMMIWLQTFLAAKLRQRLMGPLNGTPGSGS